MRLALSKLCAHPEPFCSRLDIWFSGRWNETKGLSPTKPTYSAVERQADHKLAGSHGGEQFPQALLDHRRRQFALCDHSKAPGRRSRSGRNP